jgi:hypothetical protein
VSSPPRSYSFGATDRVSLDILLTNSDSGRMSLRHVLYESRSVTNSEKLQYYAITRISSACECFPGICGYWPHHMRPTVQILGVHLPGPAIIVASGLTNALEKAGIPIPLERYFSRPIDSLYDQSTRLEHHSL